MGQKTIVLPNVDFALLYTGVVVVVLAAVFLGVSAVFNTVDLNTVPQPFMSFLYAVKTFFSVPGVVFFLIFIRNAYGYYGAKLRAKLQGQPEVTYKLESVGKTVATYLSTGTAAFALLPDPYGKIAVAIVFVGDIVISEIQTLLGNPAQAQAAAPLTS